MTASAFSPWGLWRVDAHQDPVYAGGHIDVSPEGIETWGFDAVVPSRRYAWNVSLPQEEGEGICLSAADPWGDRLSLCFLVAPEGVEVRLRLSGEEDFPWSAEVAVVRATGTSAGPPPC